MKSENLNLWVQIDLSHRLQRLLQDLFEINCGNPGMRGELVITVKDDNPDVGYSVSFNLTDSEGNPIQNTPAGLTVDVTSDKTDVVAVTKDPADPLKGTVSFGNPGNATVLVTVKKPDGSIFGSFSQEFLVTTGDPAKIASGSISFNGLTDTP